MVLQWFSNGSSNQSINISYKSSLSISRFGFPNITQLLPNFNKVAAIKVGETNSRDRNGMTSTFVGLFAVLHLKYSSFLSNWATFQPTIFFEFKACGSGKVWQYLKVSQKLLIGFILGFQYSPENVVSQRTSKISLISSEITCSDFFGYSCSTVQSVRSCKAASTWVLTLRSSVSLYGTR